MSLHPIARQHPILFAPDLAQKVHLGLKTETRRLVKPQPPADQPWQAGFDDSGHGWFFTGLDNEGDCDDQWPEADKGLKSPYQPGDLLYVRESFRVVAWAFSNGLTNPRVYLKGSYQAEGAPFELPLTVGESRRFMRWKRKLGGHPSMFMFKSLARTWISPYAVSVERVQEITEEGALAEGYSPGSARSDHGFSNWNAQHDFEIAWLARFPGSWDRNEWVFVYKFKKCEAPR